MSFRAIHLHLLTNPTPTADGIVTYACAFAKAFDGRLTVSIVRPVMHTLSHWLAAPMVASAARDVEAKAGEVANALEQLATKQAKACGIPIKVNKVVAAFPATDTDRFWLARTADLCIFPLPRHEPQQKLGVENWLFQTGHPTLLFPEAASPKPSFETILVSWDFSRAASRAVVDSLPILKQAKNVRITTVIGEKDVPVDDTKVQILEYLATHGIKAQVDEIKLGGQTIGDALLKQASSINADMIVMGAFGHSRLHEFLLGGATKGVLAKANIPLFMSH